MVEQIERVVIDGRAVRADVVVVRTDCDVLPPELPVRAGDDPDHVPRRIGNRLLGVDHVAAQRLAGGARLQRLDGGPEQLPTHRHADVEEGGGGRRGVVVPHDGDRIFQPVTHFHGNPVEARHEDAGGALVAGAHEATIDRRPGHLRVLRVRRVRQHDHDPSRRLGVRDHAGLTPRAGEDGRDAVDRPRSRPLVARQQVGPPRERAGIRGDHPALVERADHHRQHLEVTAVLAAGLQPDHPRLLGDPRRGARIGLGAELAPSHGVVGVHVEPRHQVAVGDRRCRALRRHFYRLGRRRRGQRGHAFLGACGQGVCEREDGQGRELQHTPLREKGEAHRPPCTGAGR